MEAFAHRSGWPLPDTSPKDKAVAIVAGSLILAALYLTTLSSYLLFHSLAELFSIIVACGIFMFAWNSRHFFTSGYLLFLGIAYLFIGLLDLAHTLSYSGMGIFPQPGANLPTQLWIATRFLESASLLAAFFFLQRRVPVWPIFGTYALVSFGLLITIFACHNFPNCYIEGLGLTSFKIYSEYLICLLLLAALVLLFRNRETFDPAVFRLLALSILLTIGSELAFTFYVSVYGFSNLVGHYFKILSFYLIYRAIITTGLTKPYALLFRELNQANAKLEQSRAELERKVAERTAALTATNEELRQEVAERQRIEAELRHSSHLLAERIKELRCLYRLGDLIESAPDSLDYFLSGVVAIIPPAYHYPELTCARIRFSNLEFKTVNYCQTPWRLAVDILMHDRAVGELEVCYLEEKPPLDEGPFYREERDLLAGIAERVSRYIERLQAEEKLQKSEERFRRLAENAKDLIYRMSLPDGRYEYVSPAATEILGYEPEEFYQQPVLIRELIHPDWRAAFDEQWQELLSGRLPPTYEYKIIHRSGTHRWLRQRNVLIRDQAGAPVAIEGIVSDITQLKQMIESLRDREQQVRLLLDSTAEGIFGMDLDGCCTFCNPASLRLLGYGQEELLLGKKIHELIHHSRLDGTPLSASECPALATIITQQEAHEENALFFRADGSPVPVEYWAHPMKKDDRLQGVVVTFIDTTERWEAARERNRLQDEIRQAQKMEAIGTLAGGIAHDFNNILTAMLGYTELIQSALPAGAPERANLDHVYRAGLRARDLVRQILTFSRQGEQERQPVQVHLLAKECLKLLRASLPTSIEIRTDISPDCGTVFADPTAIHQVIMNLCTNAYHAMRDTGGVLSVAVHEIALDHGADDHLQPDLYLRLTVSDTGPGMDHETMARIFEPYFTTKKKGEGTGLGLAVVHGIVTSHNGHITVTSEPGQGATFHIDLPLLAGQPALPEEKAKEEIAGGGERLLVVDDDADIMRLEQRLLEGLGYRVAGVSSGMAAMELFRANPAAFDLILTDMTMPKMGGIELANEAKAIRPDIPVILCTGYSDLASEQKARAAKVSDYLVKPVLRGELARVIRAVLDRRHSGGKE